MSETISYTLHYWDMRGRAEPIRLLLHYAGARWNDRGFKGEQWGELKPQMPLGQVPVLIEHRPEGDVKIPQSMAIMRYLAARYDLAGADAERKLAADVAAETALDLRAALSGLRYSPAWQQAEAKQEYAAKTLQLHLGRLVKRLGEGPWYAGSEPTYADLLVYDTLTAHLAHWPDCLDGLPQLSAFVARVRGLPRLADYWAKQRPAS